MQVVNAIIDKATESEEVAENEEVFDLADPEYHEFYVQKALDLIDTAYKK